jgi:hypothetical protein
MKPTKNSTKTQKEFHEEFNIDIQNDITRNSNGILN